MASKKAGEDGQLQSWSGVLSPKQLSGRVIWALAIVLAGSLLATSFGPAIFGSSTAGGQTGVSSGEPSEAAQLAPFSIVVEQAGLLVEASVPGYQGEVLWSHRVVDVGESCWPELFAVAPNHPAVLDGNRLTIPSDPERQDFWRNRWLCFQAVDEVGRQDYAVFNIDMGNPVIVVRSEESGGQDYLRIHSNEDSTTYRFIGWTPAELGAGGGDYPVAGGYCESVFVRPGRHSHQRFPNPQSVSGDRLRAEEGKVYCFEATDDEGNRAYVYADSEAVGRIYISQWGGNLRAFFGGSSSRVSWSARGPLNTPLCEESLFQLPDFSEYITPQLDSSSTGNSVSVPLGDEVLHGQHYCFRVFDPFGHQVYRGFEIDLLPPEIELEVGHGGSSSTITALTGEDTLNVWFVGPIADEELAALGCAEVFGSNLFPEYSIKYGREDSFALKADSGKFYCFRAQDRAGNYGYARYLIPDSL